MWIDEATKRTFLTVIETHAYEHEKIYESNSFSALIHIRYIDKHLEVVYLCVYTLISFSECRNLSPFFKK